MSTLKHFCWTCLAYFIVVLSVHFAYTSFVWLYDYAVLALCALCACFVLFFFVFCWQMCACRCVCMIFVLYGDAVSAGSDDLRQRPYALTAYRLRAWGHRRSAVALPGLSSVRTAICWFCLIYSDFSRFLQILMIMYLIFMTSTFFCRFWQSYTLILRVTIASCAGMHTACNTNRHTLTSMCTDAVANSVDKLHQDYA